MNKERVIFALTIGAAVVGAVWYVDRQPAAAQRIVAIPGASLAEITNYSERVTVFPDPSAYANPDMITPPWVLGAPYMSKEQLRAGSVG